MAVSVSQLPVSTLPPPAPVGRHERDFLLINIYVLARHGYIERAAQLAEALYLMGEGSPDVWMARAVLRFCMRDWAAALACIEELDRIDPAERFGSYRLNERQRMRRYLKTRCLFELNETVRARDALEIYLRHGTATDMDDEAL